MRFDLRKLMGQPGSALPFEFELSAEALSFPSVSEYLSPPIASGRIFNEAGVLHLEGAVWADMLCICDRCGNEFESEKTTEVEVVLAEEDLGDDPNLYLIQDGVVDAGEIMSTCFILDMETKFLCREDCRGLCSKCGKNLNLGDCDCRAEIDPRFAVLQQLINQEE